MPLRECERYVRRVLGSVRTQRQFPKAAYHSTRVVVTEGRGNDALTDRKRSRITVPEWARTRLFLLHETAHLLTPLDVPVHGREYAGVFLKLVGHWLGSPARRTLLQSFEVHGVRYD